MLGAQRRVAVPGDDELEAQPVVVLEATALARSAGWRYPLPASRAGPEVQSRLGSHAELERVDHPRARAPASRAGELEPGEDRARGALLVPEVQVVGLGRVEVDGLLDEPQAEDVGVEVDVPLRVAGDHRDVVHALELHGSPRGTAQRA